MGVKRDVNCFDPLETNTRVEGTVEIDRESLQVTSFKDLKVVAIIFGQEIDITGQVGGEALSEAARAVIEQAEKDQEKENEEVHEEDPLEAAKAHKDWERDVS